MEKDNCGISQLLQVFQLLEDKTQEIRGVPFIHKVFPREIIFQFSYG